MPLLSMLLLKTWEDCRLCWEAKGFKLDSITPELATVGKYGRSTIGKLMNTTRDAPPEVVEKVWSLELVPGASQRKYEIYLRGLEASNTPGSIPPQPVKVQPVDVEALAAGVADKVAARVPSAGDIAEEVSVWVRAKTEEALGAVGTKVEAAAAKTGGQLAELATQVSDARDKLDQAGHTLQLVHAQQGGMDSRMRKLGQALWGLSFVMALGFSALVLVAWRNGTVDLALTYKGVPGIHGEMGEPKTGKPVPDHPLRSQLRAPCGMGATALSGGCWIEVANQKPPCLPHFYFRGNACYLPAVPDSTPDDKPQFSPNPE